jgi:magnesium and cobalt transporter
MNHEINPSPPQSWLERIIQSLIKEPKDRTRLLQLLRDAVKRNILDADSLNMIEGVLRVSEMQVRDVMIPRAQMIVIEGDATPESALPIVIESGHSRFPVIGDSRDEILGILLAKDLLPFKLNAPDQDFRIKQILRSVLFIPETKRLNILLKEFRVSRNHMAIVVDEYGGIAGLVTIEDLLEEIVGDIEDEFDAAEEPNIRLIKKNEFLVKALTPIDELNNYFDTHFSDEEFDTVGGLVLQQFNHLPKRGETTTLGKFKITVIQSSQRGIVLLRLAYDPTIPETK